MSCSCAICRAHSRSFWLGLVVILVVSGVAVALSGCGSTQLPPEKCTPAHQSARLAVCERALQLECEMRPDLTCPDKALCKEALAEVCP